MKKLYRIPLLLVTLVSTILPVQAHAQTSNYTANVTADSSNDILINGQSTATDYTANNDTVNVTFTDNAGSQILICYKGASGQSVTNGSSASIPVPVNVEAELTISFTSGNCSNGGGTPGYLDIQGASGSLSCPIVSGKVWNITGQYSHVPQTISLYNGSALSVSIHGSTGSGNSFNTSINEEYSGQTSPTTYYVYDGPSNASELIGQVSCPAIQGAASPSSANTTKALTTATTPSSTTTTPTAAAPATTQPTAITNSPNEQAAKPANSATPKKLAAKNTGLYVAGSLIMLALVVLAILQLTGVWTKPKQLLQRVLHPTKKTGNQI